MTNTLTIIKITRELDRQLTMRGLDLDIEKFEEAVEKIMMDMAMESIRYDQALDNWLEDTENNYPEFFEREF